MSLLKGSNSRKFLLSSYPSPLLERYTKEHGWNNWSIEQPVSVNAKSGKLKSKIEMLTSNYPFELKEEHRQQREPDVLST